MSMISRRGLPLGPLLHAYGAGGVPSMAELHRLPGLGGRFAAILGASARFLYADFLDRASSDEFRDALLRFYQATVSAAFHGDTLARRAGFLRHAVSHLIHGRDPAPRRLAACLSACGPYRIPGLGPSFWSALLQALGPARYPGLTPAVRVGLARALGRSADETTEPAEVYSLLTDLHARVRSVRPEMTSLHIDHFLSQIAHMQGRDFASGAGGLTDCPVGAVVRRLRSRQPLRERLKQRGQQIADAQGKVERALAERDATLLIAALALADSVGAARANLDARPGADAILDIAARLWHSAAPAEELARVWDDPAGRSAGLWLAAAILHLREPQQFGPFSDPHRLGHARLDEGVDSGDAPAQRYQLYNVVGLWLREHHSVHPLEAPEVFAALSGSEETEPRPRAVRRVPNEPATFQGFCADTFAFLAELEQENRRGWMQAQRDRYQFAVRGPLAELCTELTVRFVEPVLVGIHGWPLDTLCRSGHALTSVCRNVFGKSHPYNSTLWITFCLKGSARSSAQLFVCLSPAGLRWGMRLGRRGGEHCGRLRENLARHAEVVWQLLHDNGAPGQCLFGPADTPRGLKKVTDASALVAWSAERTLEVSESRRADDPLLRDEHLVGAILLTLDRLLPLFACAVEADPRASLTRLGGKVEAGEPIRSADFCRLTHLDEQWLRRATELLSIKKQLILQGVPGTGKTHVAHCLARLMARGCGEAVRLVQFHPAYGYEEFVEGVRVRSVAVEGRHDVTYPVEDGLLCDFAARAAERPAQPHVLIIDEINRGNLPRIFGELLYLLEYRGQAVELPCSRRSFRLPDNLYLLATMNASDRSIAVVDQALRRRFSFLLMEPDAGVLAAWLRAHPPVEGALSGRILELFERLNAKLRSEAGPQAQVGHSYFMVENIDEARLRMIWAHHIRPLLDEVFAGQPGRAAAYDALLDSPGRSRAARASGTQVHS